MRKFFLPKVFFVNIDEYFQNMAIIKAVIIQAKVWLSQKKLLV